MFPEAYVLYLKKRVTTPADKCGEKFFRCCYFLSCLVTDLQTHLLRVF